MDDIYFINMEHFLKGKVLAFIGGVSSIKKKTVHLGWRAYMFLETTTSYMFQSCSSFFHLKMKQEAGKETTVSRCYNICDNRLVFAGNRQG